MIKNLLNADEQPPEGTKVIIEETVAGPPGFASAAAGSEPPASSRNPENDAENRFFNADEKGELSSVNEAELEAALADLGIDVHAPTNLPESDAEPRNGEIAPAEASATAAAVPVAAEKHRTTTSDAGAPTIFQNDYQSQSADETVRASGLAYSAAIVLFGAIVMMMIFGWLADLLFGTSPWGVVGGILLGGIIGFVQFFRITSGIFKK